MDTFPAKLGARERLVTYGVGYGVGIGVPLILGLGFTIGFGDPRALLIPLPFIVAFGLPMLFRPTGFGISADEISVLRPIGPKRFPLSDVREVISPASSPDGTSVGILRVEGMHGRFGTYWNRRWGRHRVYITDERTATEIRFADASRLLVSPTDPAAFLAAMRHKADVAGVPIQIGRG